MTARQPHPPLAHKETWGSTTLSISHRRSERTAGVNATQASATVLGNTDEQPIFLFAKGVSGENEDAIFLSTGILPSQ